MNILYDDRDLVIFIKEPGTDSEKISARDLYGDADGGQLYCVHRLDREVGGVTVYAKNAKTASLLSAGFADRSIKKTYLALCEGRISPGAGQMQDLLFHDRRSNKTYIVQRERKDVKKASLSYETVRYGMLDPQGTGRGSVSSGRNGGDESPGFPVSLVRVELHTGRTHQIRIQFASRKHPLAGDRRYGSRSGFRKFGLWSLQLCLEHPFTKEKMMFTSEPDWTV